MCKLLTKTINRKVLAYDDYCNKIAEKNYFTNVYGLARSLLAAGTLVSIVFNSKYVIFPEHLLKYYKLIQRKPFIDFNIFYFFDYENFYIAKALSILILIIVVIGIYPRITGILHWWISFSYYTAAGLPEGGDQIAAILTLLLIPVTILDNRSNHWNKSKENNEYKNFIVAIVLFIIQVQMSIIYLHASIEKFYKSEFWVDGTAVYYWFNDSLFGMTETVSLVITPLINIPLLLSILTWGVLLFELVLFGAIFMSSSNKEKLFKYGIAFHFMIIVIHGLVSFFFAMAGGLVLYLLKKEKSINFTLITSKLSLKNVK